MKNNEQFEKIVSLCKRRGFIYQSSEIYGGLANVYDYGPLGAEMLRNIRNAWWSHFVTKKRDVVGIESQIFMHPTTWVASGHVAGFADPMIEDLKNKKRYRADHIIEDWQSSNDISDVDPDALSLEELDAYIEKNKILSPDGNKLSKARNFNLLFETEVGVLEGEKSKLYLRGETAQGMFVLFKNIMDSTRVQIPFGIAQQGKAFRNEITKGKFIFRTLEFEQMELQFFIKESDWEKTFQEWEKEIDYWYETIMQIPPEKLQWKPHHPDKLAHYAKKASDLQYKFSWGFDEVSGLHYRTDFDLKTHEEHSGQKIRTRDLQTNEEFTPHDIESTWGLNRNLFMLLDNAYTEEGDRTYLNLPTQFAPYKVAIFPLVKNKPELVTLAQDLYDRISEKHSTYWDDRGNIGKRYAYQDEIGTPLCITVDYDTLDTGKVTVRDRNTTKQEDVNIDQLEDYLAEKLK
ncbi:glycine--tRNA ligase [Candidatus Peregrinibacteria bacterium HGW-Peregrinibacteria-1]|jgi:glycyl-tRNA synthetase|nr:MAG: glycine--tRNA ligase [Candidatus Peregrinibacteria bacterium HGW-Peregrinibacteria-1]